MAKKLYIPGPTQVSPDMLAAMAQPMIGHRTKEYAALHKDVVEHLRWLLNTRERVFLSTSSSFGIMEGAVRNLVGKRCVNFANGAFSKKWHDVTLRCGKEADMVVLSSDITACAPEKITDAKVLGTMIGGEWVYTSKK